jgi:hypothetical protein
VAGAGMAMAMARAATVMAVVLCLLSSCLSCSLLSDQHGSNCWLDNKRQSGRSRSTASSLILEEGFSRSPIYNITEQDIYLAVENCAICDDDVSNLLYTLLKNVNYKKENQSG